MKLFRCFRTETLNSRAFHAIIMARDVEAARLEMDSVLKNKALQVYYECPYTIRDLKNNYLFEDEFGNL